MAATVLLAACAAPFLAKVQDDTWWHLRAGLEMLRTGRPLLVDTFSHTSYGAYWPNYQWLGEVVLAGAYAGGGMPLLAVLCGVVIATTTLLSWRLTRGSLEMRALLLLVALPSISPVWSVRPQVFSALLALVTTWLILKDRRHWLPFVFVVWVNGHGGILYGFVLMAADGVVLGASRDWPRLRRTLVWAAASFAATFITPLGRGYWPAVTATIERSRPSRIQEWQPTPLAAEQLAFWGMLAAVVALALILARRRTAQLGRDDWFLIVSSVLLGAAAIRAQRTGAMFMLLAVPATSRMLSAAYPSRGRSSELTTEGRGLAHAAVFAVLVLVAAVGVPWLRAARPDIVGAQPMSGEAARAIAACPPPLYNHYNDGGVIIWFVREQKVFLDTRQDPFPIELVREQIRADDTGEYAALLDRHQLNCAAVRLGSSEIAALNSAGWRETFSDDQWVVLVRSDKSP